MVLNLKLVPMSGLQLYFKAKFLHISVTISLRQKFCILMIFIGIFAQPTSSHWVKSEAFLVMTGAGGGKNLRFFLFLPISGKLPKF